MSTPKNVDFSVKNGLLKHSGRNIIHVEHPKNRIKNVKQNILVKNSEIRCNFMLKTEVF